jgi:Zn-dependent metalloprotease
VRADASPEQAARGFLRTYGRLVGVADEARELRTAKVTTRHGRSNVRLRQTIGSVPVLGGELVVETTRDGEVASVTGETTAHRPPT